MAKTLSSKPQAKSLVINSSLKKQPSIDRDLLTPLLDQSKQ